MPYEPQKYEDTIYKLWEESGFFNPDNLKKAKKPFVVSMPPPNATGVLHIGHASGLAYGDILIRYKRLQGYRTLWLPGTDHAAIATQTKVEKILAQEGTDRHKLGREKFLTRVKQFVAESQDTIRNQTRKMGSSCDWSRERYTFDEGLSRAVNEAFVRMYQDGLIYRGHRIVNWCPRCASTLADDEVNYKEQSAKLYFIKYGPLTIATTRPETKLADTGVAVNPDDKRYKKYIGKDLDIDLAGHKIRVKVFADKEVDPKFGSGAVGVTPGHSAVDFAWAQKHNLKIVKLIDETGHILETGGKYKGLDVLTARQKFIKDLEAAKQIIKVEDYQNNLSICYRCDTPVEPLTSDQWFVSVKKLKPAAIKAVKSGQIKIVPPRFGKIYDHWMQNLHDWCISRQIWWGHRIPVWYKDQEIYVGHEAPKGSGWTQDPDTLDTWFSSALWTFSTLGWPDKTKDLKNFHPTSVMETGYDLIFFWVARMILMSEYLLKQKPFDVVYLHGMIRDEQGRKMSKSLGNGIDPIDMINQFGADALRLSLIIGSGAGADLNLYETKIAGYRNFVNKLWNISRFVLTTVKKVSSIKNKPKATTLADTWILAEFDNLISEITKDLDNFRFSQAGERLYEFTRVRLADWYLEIAKIEGNKDEILLYILERLLVLWHPFTPFVTEEIYREFNSGLLMVRDWPAYAKASAGRPAKSLALFLELQEAVTKIRNLKADNKIPPKDLPDCILESKIFKQNELEVIARLSRVNLVKDLQNFQSFKTANINIKINLHKEISAKAKADLEKYIKNLEARLQNPEFLKSAPTSVIEQTKEKLVKAKASL